MRLQIRQSESNFTCKQDVYGLSFLLCRRFSSHSLSFEDVIIETKLNVLLDVGMFNLFS